MHKSSTTDKTRYPILAGIKSAAIGSAITAVIYFVIFSLTTTRYEFIGWFLIPVAISSFFAAFFSSRNLLTKKLKSDDR